MNKLIDAILLEGLYSNNSEYEERALKLVNKQKKKIKKKAKIKSKCNKKRS